MNQKKWIAKFADKWNEKFKLCAGAYVGRMNVEYMLKSFLRAYKRRKK